MNHYSETWKKEMMLHTKSDIVDILAAGGKAFKQRIAELEAELRRALDLLCVKTVLKSGDGMMEPTCEWIYDGIGNWKIGNLETPCRASVFYSDDVYQLLLRSQYCPLCGMRLVLGRWNIDRARAAKSLIRMRRAEEGESVG